MAGYMQVNISLHEGEQVACRLTGYMQMNRLYMQANILYMQVKHFSA